MVDDSELREAIRQIARDEKVTCGELLALAERTGTPPRRVGELCDEMSIRIRACQLGCFE